jgi:hypothetical protein
MMSADATRYVLFFLAGRPKCRLRITSGKAGRTAVGKGYTLGMVSLIRAPMLGQRARPNCR